MRWVAALMGMFALGYLAMVFALYCVQDALIYPGSPNSLSTLEQWAKQVGASPTHLTAADGTGVYALHRPASGRRGLLVLHGNGSDASMGLWFAAHLPDVDVMSITYRGYPGAGEASPTEVGLLQDARAGWDHLVATGVHPEHIIVHGQSLGGGVANQLVHQLVLEGTPPAGLSLESTFRSIEAIAAQRFWFLPVRALLLHPYNSELRAPDIDVPVFISHGTSDSLVPVDHARTMVTRYPNAELHEVAGAEHNTWMLDDPAVRAAWVPWTTTAWQNAPR